MNPRALTYVEALGVLDRALKFGIHPSLSGIRALTLALGHPEASFQSAQVTGTNGKTSVTRLLSAILNAHGLRVGTYTSPHLVSYAERISVDGASVSEDAFARELGRTLDAADELAKTGAAEYTEFELLTASALCAFEEASVHWAVLEVGMGGRWDATSVVAPAVAAITGVALDHTDRLGSTREAIAADKAQIIKPGCVAVIGPGCIGVEDVFVERAAEVGAPMVRVGLPASDVWWEVTETPSGPGGFLRLDVSGALGRYTGLAVQAPAYQAPNVAVAIAAAEAALGSPLDADAMRDALARMTFPGRFELVCERPPVIVDGAHNPEAAAVLARAVREAFGDVKPVFVLGVMADKDAVGIISALVPVASGFVCTRSRSERALPAEKLSALVDAHGGRVLGVTDDVGDALTQALASEPLGVVCAGSIYVAGEVKAALAGTDRRRCDG